MLCPVANASSFFSAYTQSDLFGKAIIWGLFALSVLSWVVLLHKFLLVREARKISKQFQARVEEERDTLLSIDVRRFAQPRSPEAPHPFCDIFLCLKKKTLEVLEKNRFFVAQSAHTETSPYLSKADLELIESHVLTTISMQSKKLDANLFVLSTTVSLAPFLGLLGTVWGILVSFSGLQQSSAAGSNSLMLAGIATALCTTVLGLVIAIPALISHSYLRSAVKTFSSEMEDFLYLLLSHVELQYRKVE